MPNELADILRRLGPAFFAGCSTAMISLGVNMIAFLGLARYTNDDLPRAVYMMVYGIVFFSGVSFCSGVGISNILLKIWGKTDIEGKQTAEIKGRRDLPNRIFSWTASSLVVIVLIALCILVRWE